MTDAPLRIAFIGTYPPTQCGIATFTESLRSAVRDSELTSSSPVTTGVIRLVEASSPLASPPVVADWVRDDPSSTARAAAIANGYDSVILQHEFGIFGGPDGEDVLDFMHECRSPVVSVLHTVVLDPTKNQRRIIESLCDASAVVVVQTAAARARLLGTHHVPEHRVVVVPHGAAENFGDQTLHRRAADEQVVLTWGLVGPGKGIEHGIAAIAALGQRGGPTPRYVVMGQTHPNVLAHEGERYRSSLVELAAELGVADRVEFDATYHEWSSLRARVREADVVLLPYDSRDQVTSGVLVEAIASGKPVVATAFPHAIEMLSSGAGVVVPHGDPTAMADALGTILRPDGDRERMEAEARRRAECLLWPRVGAEYLALAQSAASAAAIA